MLTWEQNMANTNKSNVTNERGLRIKTNTGHNLRKFQDDSKKDFLEEDHSTLDLSHKAKKQWKRIIPKAM